MDPKSLRFADRRRKVNGSDIVWYLACGSWAVLTALVLIGLVR